MPLLQVMTRAVTRWAGSAPVWPHDRGQDHIALRQSHRVEPAQLAPVPDLLGQRQERRPLRPEISRPRCRGLRQGDSRTPAAPSGAASERYGLESHQSAPGTAAVDFPYSPQNGSIFRRLAQHALRDSNGDFQAPQGRVCHLVQVRQLVSLAMRGGFRNDARSSASGSTAVADPAWKLPKAKQGARFDSRRMGPVDNSATSAGDA